ncbi:MAG TPA: VTT domain-containing protein [Candidatus Woesebacteria bacterium]|nr:VTT domain-containing protein [Candidatus Woesebacteria bacterium]
MLTFEQLFSVKLANRALLVLGVVFIVLTFFIALDPAYYAQFGYLGVFLFNLFGPGTILVPLMADHFNLGLLALISAFGMSANDSIVYLIGRTGQAVVLPGKKSSWARQLVARHGRLGLFAISLVPFPLDFVGGTVGYLGFSYRYYLLPTFAGKFLRFLALGIVARWLI